MAFVARDLVIDLSTPKVPPSQPNPKPECEVPSGITGGPVAEDMMPPHLGLAVPGAAGPNTDLAELRAQLRAVLAASKTAA